jgi:hypothetical protein
MALMRLVDARFLYTPWYDSRQGARHLRREGYTVGRKRVRCPMGKMRLAPIYQRPRTTVPHPGRRVWPTCCATSRLIDQTRSGVPTSPTYRCGAAFCSRWR